MKKNKKTKKNFLLSLICSCIMLFIIDTVIILSGHTIPLAAAIVGFILLAALLRFADEEKKGKFIKVFFIVIISISTAVSFCEFLFIKNASYKNIDNSRNAFSNKRVMFIVPHEDDDYNIAGGIIEQYAKSASNVFVVFVTNGDGTATVNERYNEAKSVLEESGISDNNIILLGYGDKWKSETHLYNAPPNETQISVAGNNKTYGADNHPAFNNGNDYTSNNFISDIQNVILKYKPDIIFCNDYDGHSDHKATSLGFEKAMGNILKSNSNYTPVVLKGYAYSTAWTAEEDYLNENVLSTKNCFNKKDNPQTPAVYDWNKRIRLPLESSYFSRSLFGSRGYKQMKKYTTQNALLASAAVINGDKVFWQRRTDSVLTKATITENKKKIELLNDFMLLENNNINDKKHQPYDGVFKVEKDDEIIIKFSEKYYINYINLYDNPSAKSNIKNAQLIFDDGSIIETGALTEQGAPTKITVNKATSSFVVKIIECEGKSPGLTEIEAFESEESFTDDFIKLKNKNDDFIYDYFINKSGTEEFSLYSPFREVSDFSIKVNNPKCSAFESNGKILVNCPKKQKCKICITDNKTKSSDTVNISNPGNIKRTAIKAMQKTEKTIYKLNPRGRKHVIVRLYYFTKTLIRIIKQS